MDKTTVAEARKVESIGKKVLLRGCVRTRRDSKGGFSFIELNDGCCQGNVQDVAPGELPNYEAVVKHLHTGADVHDKKVFGLGGQADIFEAVRGTGRAECVLVGLETDVCICHSALGLIDRGFRVAAIEDATASPPPHHEAGLRRMAAGGVTLTNTKGIYYEWVRDLATNSRVKSQITLPTPEGLTL